MAAGFCDDEQKQYENKILLECLHDYDARKDEELSFRKGQVLVQLDNSDKFRILARHTVDRHQEGYVPRNYVYTRNLHEEDSEDDMLLECLHDYDAREKDELSFKKGEVLLQLDNSNKFRLLARHTDRKFQEGYVPIAYVRAHSLKEEDSENDMLLECLHDYDAREKDELSFKKGEVLLQLDNSNKFRLLARHTDRKFQEGYVPIAYVRAHSLKEEGSGDYEEVLNSDPRTRLLYERALKEGKEIDNTVRVMIIGCHTQGKTSLVRKLLGQAVSDVSTTDGIEVKQCNIETNLMWKEVEREDLGHDIYKRLAKIARSNESSSYKAQLANIPKRTGKPIPGSVRDRINEIERRLQNQRNLSSHDTDVNALKKFKSELRKNWSTNTDESEIKMNIWDFGGQYIYYATHQIFHSRQSVYLLVFNLAEGLDVKVKANDFPRKSETKTMRDYIRFWVNSVHSFVGSKDGKKPVIILVGTFKDKLQRGANVEGCFEEIRKMFDGSTALFHFYHKHFAISNVTSDSNELERLRSTIIRVAKENRQGHIPGKWIPLEERLKEARSSKIITFKELLRLDQLNAVPVQDVNQKGQNDDIRLFLRYHHARGTFCYFDDGSPSEYVVLDPQYLIDAFKCIITSEMFCKVRPEMRTYWTKLCKEAVLEPVLLDAVWRKNNEKNFIKFKKVLIQFLEKFRIISEMQRYDEDFKGKGQPLRKYIVPSLLKFSADDRTVESFLQGKCTSNVSIGYTFECDSLLPTLYQRTLSAMTGQWPLIKYDGKFVVFDNVVACKLQHDHAGVLMLVENRLELLVVNLCPPQGVKSNVCDMFRRFVEMILGEELHRFREVENAKERRVSQYAVRCFNTSHGYSGSKGTLTFSDTDSCRILPCPDFRSHCVDLSRVKQNWFLQDNFSMEIPKRRLTEREYSLLSMAIGDGWQHIGHVLRIDEIQIQHIEMEHKTTAYRIYAMFLKWDRTYDDNATLDVLVRAILSCSAVAVNWDTLRTLINGFNT